MGSIRMVIAKLGPDGHDRRREGGGTSPAAALQEDADAVGLSVLSGAHMTRCRVI